MDRNYSVKLRRKAFLVLTFAVGFVGMVGSLSATDFMDVTDTALPTNTPTPTGGNPIWGDIDNDGYLDLIMSTFRTTGCTSSCSACLVFRNNRDGTFTLLRGAAGFASATSFDGEDGHSTNCAFQDTD